MSYLEFGGGVGICFCASPRLTGPNQDDHRLLFVGSDGDGRMDIFVAGPVVVKALIGGDLQGGSGATNAVINAILNGAPIIGVAATANRPYHRLFVQPEINRLEDLKGKTLGVTRFGSITDNLTRILLRKSGLEGTVNVRQMGGTIEVQSAPGRGTTIRVQFPVAR